VLDFVTKSISQLTSNRTSEMRRDIIYTSYTLRLL